MFETLTVITVTTMLFFFWQNKRLGLTAPVPKDPLARAHWQASQCLETFKTKLAGATVKSLEESRLRATLKDSTFDLWCEGGNVLEQAVGGTDKPQVLHSLGPGGSLHFRRLSEQALFVKIVADDGPSARHEVGLRLEVQMEP